MYFSSYLHDERELELNVVHGKGVICNLFANNPLTNQRISWKNVELSTVFRNDKVMYCLRTNGYNHIAKADDRRIHDISDIGISFYVSQSFVAKTNQLTVTFSDTIDVILFYSRLELPRL